MFGRKIDERMTYSGDNLEWRNLIKNWSKNETWSRNTNFQNIFFVKNRTLDKSIIRYKSPPTQKTF